MLFWTSVSYSSHQCTIFSQWKLILLIGISDQNTLQSYLVREYLRSVGSNHTDRYQALPTWAFIPCKSHWTLFWSEKAEFVHEIRRDKGHKHWGNFIWELSDGMASIRALLVFSTSKKYFYFQWGWAFPNIITRLCILYRSRPRYQEIENIASCLHQML